MGWRSLPAIAAARSAFRAETTPPGEAGRPFAVGTFSDAERIAGGRFAETGARCRQLCDPAVAEETGPPVLWIDPTGARGRWTTPATNRRRVAVVAAAGRTPLGGVDGESTLVAASGEVPARANPSPSPSSGVGPRTLREPVRTLSLPPLSARVRPPACTARACTEHDAGDGYGSAGAEVDRMPEDPVALLHSGLIPEHDVRHPRTARVHTSPTPNGAA